MKNKVTVSRAPRLNLVSPSSCHGTTFLVNTEDKAIWVRSNGGMLCLDSDSGEILTNRQWHSRFIAFENADAMCKWVAGGRHIEDMQVYNPNEWVKFPEIPIGTIFSYGGGTITAIKSDYGMSVKLDGDIGNVMLSIDKLALVWPVRFDLGDTITIEITE